MQCILDESNPSGLDHYYGHDSVLSGNYNAGLDVKDEDIEFMARAREDIPRLLDEIERLKDELAERPDAAYLRYDL